MKNNLLSSLKILLVGLRSIFKSFLDIGSWGYLAWFDIKLRYRRTVIGPWWNTLTAAAMVGSVGLVWGVLLGDDIAGYLPYFAVGNIIWAFIASFVGESCIVLSQNSNIIKSIPIPISTYLFRMTVRQLIILAHSVVLLVILWIILRWKINSSILLVIPGLLILTLNLLGVSLVLSIIGTRFRDFQQFITVALQLLYFLTPILWNPSRLMGKGMDFIVNFNPIYYIIELIRHPILGNYPPGFFWLISIGCAIFSLLLGSYFIQRYEKRVAFWL